MYKYGKVEKVWWILTATLTPLLFLLSILDLVKGGLFGLIGLIGAACLCATLSNTIDFIRPVTTESIGNLAGRK